MILEPCDSLHITVSASTIVSDRPCIVRGVILTPAAAASEIQLFDAQLSTATAIKVDVKQAASVGSNVFMLSNGIMFNNGCTAVVTGSGAVAEVLFSKI